MASSGEEEMRDDPLMQMEDENSIENSFQPRMASSAPQPRRQQPRMQLPRMQQPPVEGSGQQQPEAGMQPQPPTDQPPDQRPKVETARTQTTQISTAPRPPVDGTPAGVHRDNGMLDTLDHVFFPAMMSLTRKFNASLPNFGEAMAQTILQAEEVVRVSKIFYNSQFDKPTRNVPRHISMSQLVSSCVNSCHHVSSCVNSCHRVSCMQL